MPQTQEDRYKIMGDALAEIISQKYIYSLSKGSSNFTEMPPKPGTEMNCEAAARLLKRLAEEKRGLEGNDLKIVYFGPKDGFFVLSNGEDALGTSRPHIISDVISGWEFEKHYRVQDPVCDNKVYDPIFGTSGRYNPSGILASGPSTVTDQARSMVSIYGEKYKITHTLNQPVKVELLSNDPVDPKWIVDDSKFQPRA